MNSAKIDSDPNPTLLIIITSDPRSSHRAGEAIRIAAGVGAWKKVDVLVYLRDAAVLVLGECPEALVDEGNISRYLPALGDSNRPVYVQRGAPLLVEAGERALPVEEIDDAQLAALAASCTYLLGF